MKERKKRGWGGGNGGSKRWLWETEKRVGREEGEGEQKAPPPAPATELRNPPGLGLVVGRSRRPSPALRQPMARGGRGEAAWVPARAPCALGAAAALAGRSSRPSSLSPLLLPPALRASPLRSDPCGRPGARSVAPGRVSPLRPCGDGHQDRQGGLPGGVQPGARRRLGRHLVRNFPLLSKPRSPSSRGAWCTEPSSKRDGLRVIPSCLPQP